MTEGAAVNTPEARTALASNHVESRRGQPNGSPALALAQVSAGIGNVVLVCIVLGCVTGVETTTLSQGFVFATLLLYIAAVLGTGGMLTLLFSFFSLFFIAIPAYAQTTLGRYPFGGSYSDQLISDAYLICAVSLIAFNAANLLARSRNPHAAAATARSAAANVRSEQITRTSFPVADRALVRFVVLLIVVAIATALAAGPANFLLNRGEFSEVGSGDGSRAQLVFAARSVSFAAALLAVQMRRSRTGGISLRVAGSALVVAVTLNLPWALPRFQLLGIVLAFGVIFFDTFALKFKLVFSFAAPAFLFFAFAAVKELGFGGRVELAPARSYSDFFVSPDYDVFKQIMDTVRYVDLGEPSRQGENFLGVLLFWVPRAVWESKPENSGELVASRLGYPYTNVSSPLQAESFLSGGFPSIVLIFVLLGLFVAILERRIWLSGSASPVASALLAVVAAYLVIILRGALNAIIPPVGFAVVAIVLAGMIRARVGGRSNA